MASGKGPPKPKPKRDTDNEHEEPRKTTRKASEVSPGNRPSHVVPDTLERHESYVEQCDDEGPARPALDLKKQDESGDPEKDIARYEQRQTEEINEPKAPQCFLCYVQGVAE